MMNVRKNRTTTDNRRDERSLFAKNSPELTEYQFDSMNAPIASKEANPRRFRVPDES